MKRYKVLGIIYFVVGAASASAGLFIKEVMGKSEWSNIFAFGIAMAVCGILYFVRYRIFLHYPKEKQERLEAVTKDERNIYINNMAKASAFNITVIASAISIVTFNTFPNNISDVSFASSIFVIAMVSYLVAYLVISQIK